MSKWYLTSSPDAHECASRACAAAALRPAGLCKTRQLYGQTYYKRADPVATFAECGEEDWVFCAGTLVYEGHTGKTALAALHSDYLSHGICYVRSVALGHYAIALSRGPNVEVFTDPQAAITLYYAQNRAGWFVATSLELFASAGFASAVDRDRLLITALETSPVGERTFYEGVRRLFESQVIHISAANHSLEVSSLPVEVFSTDYALMGLQEAAERYAAEVREVFEQLVSVGPIGLLGTGGLDSRTVLAGLLDRGAGPTILYGLGNSGLTDDHPRDFAVARRLAQDRGLHFVRLDWAGEQPHSESTLRALFDRYGFKYEIYGAPHSLLAGFEDGLTPTACLFMGGYSPAFTNQKPWDLPHSRFTFPDLIRHAMAKEARDARMLCSESYAREYAVDAHEALERHGIEFPDDGSVGLSEFVKAYLILGLWPQDRFVNFANEFVQYVAPFHLKRLYEPLVTVRPEIRSRDKFQICVVHELAPRLLELPLFSGHRPSTINQSTWEMTRSVEVATRLAQSADIVLPRAVRRPIKRFVRRLLYRQSAREEDRDGAIRDAYAEAVLADPLMAGCFTDVRYLHLKMLERLRHYLLGIHAYQQ